jgi:hypothetical protein
MYVDVKEVRPLGILIWFLEMKQEESRLYMYVKNSSFVVFKKLL